MKPAYSITLAAALSGLAACAGAAPRATNGTTSPAEALTATPLQYRDDVVADRLQLQLHNGLDEALQIIAIEFQWAGFSSEVADTRLTISAGQRVDLPVTMREPECQIDGLVVQPAPDVAGAKVLLTLVDSTTRTAVLSDPNDTLIDIHAAGCQEEVIRQQAAITFDDLHLETVAGRPITVGVLRITRGLARGELTVLSATGTIPFQLSFPGGVGVDQLLMLPIGNDAAEVEVHFGEGRCDAHAVAETKQPFRFVLQVDLGDGVTRPLEVEPDSALHAQMLATVAQGCATLGLDGSLRPEE